MYNDSDEKFISYRCTKLFINQNIVIWTWKRIYYMHSFYFFETYKKQECIH